MDELLACYQCGLLYLGAIADTGAKEASHPVEACDARPAAAAAEDNAFREAAAA